VVINTHAYRIGGTSGAHKRTSALRLASTECRRP
jgi:hypothetical protein